MRWVRLALVALCFWPSATPAQTSVHLAKIEADLARALDDKIDEIGKRSTYADRVSEAKSRLLAAQAEWRNYREVECAAKAAVAILISAQPLENLKTSCMYFMTERRIADIAKY